MKFSGGKREWKRRGSSEHQYLRGDWNKNNRAGREVKEIEQDTVCKNNDLTV